MNKHNNLFKEIGQTGEKGNEFWSASGLVVLFIMLLMSISCLRSGNLKEINLHDVSKNENCQTVSLDSIVDSSEVIELDNSEKAPIIGVISSLYESDRSFYIISDDKFVYEYDKAGRFIRQIGTQGRGPGEYLSVEGISVNDKDSSVNLFDFPSQKFVKYDQDGHYIISFKPQFEDTLLYLQSFYPYKDSLLFYTSNNSSRMDLFLLNQSADSMETISRKNRTILPEELIIDNVFIFGDKQNPYIYNYFNDTIFILKNKKLVPAMLARIGKLRTDYDELFMEKWGNSGKKELNMRNIVQGGDLIFFFYSISINVERARFPFLSLYNVASNSYTQNVQIKDNKDSLLTIGSQDKVFQGYSANDILVVKGQPENDKNPVIIKFRMK